LKIHAFMCPWICQSPSNHKFCAHKIKWFHNMLLYARIIRCDSMFQTHYLMFGKGFQTWEYSPVYAIRSYAYLLLHTLPMRLYGLIFTPNPVKHSTHLHCSYYNIKSFIFVRLLIWYILWEVQSMNLRPQQNTCSF